MRFVETAGVVDEKVGDPGQQLRASFRRALLQDLLELRDQGSGCGHGRDKLGRTEHLRDDARSTWEFEKYGRIVKEGFILFSRIGIAWRPCAASDFRYILVVALDLITVGYPIGS
jgi:hypothetical protein